MWVCLLICLLTHLAIATRSTASCLLRIIPLKFFTDQLGRLGALLHDTLEPHERERRSITVADGQHEGVVGRRDTHGYSHSGGAPSVETGPGDALPKYEFWFCSPSDCRFRKNHWRPLRRNYMQNNRRRELALRSRRESVRRSWFAVVPDGWHDKRACPRQQFHRALPTARRLLYRFRGESLRQSDEHRQDHRWFVEVSLKSATARLDRIIDISSIVNSSKDS